MSLGLDQAWAIAYILTVGAVITIVRIEIWQIRSEGTSFHREYAEHVRKLQESAWNAVTQDFPQMCPTIKQLILSPPAAPKDEDQEATLRSNFQAASSEIAKLQSAFDSIASPDTLFQSICDGYKQKGTDLWNFTTLCLLTSAAFPSYLVVDAYFSGRLGAVLPYFVEVVLMAGLLGLVWGNRILKRDDLLDARKASLVKEVDKKVHHILPLPTGNPSSH